MTEKNIEKLAYIQSTGTQYIDTEYIPKANTIFEMDIQFVENEYKTNPQLFKTGMTNTFFGAIDSGTQMFSANFGGGTAQWGEVFSWNNKGNSYGGSIKSMYCGDVLFERNVFRMTKNAVNYVRYMQLEEKTKNHEKLSMFLFGVNSEIDKLHIYTFARHDMKLYSCRIYEDDVLIKDFIPAKLGNKIGLYDNVSKKFHENKGTGEFLYETEVIE